MSDHRVSRIKRLAAAFRAARKAYASPPSAPAPPDDPGVDVDGPPDERAWMQTVTGRRFYPLAPRSEDVDVYDVAHGLAMCCRYAGHASRFYSVAEHCVHVSREVERRMRDANRVRHTEHRILQWSLLALLHDSAEAYIGDMIRPLKNQPEMAQFRAVELAIEKSVLAALLPEPAYGADRAWDLVKEIDDGIIADEIRVLKHDVAMYSDVTAPPLGVRLELWSPEGAREGFLYRYYGLKRSLARSAMPRVTRTDDGAP